MQPLALTAIDLYEKSHAQGWWYRLWSALRGRPGHLLDLRAVAAEHTIRARRADGAQVVPIRQILGTEGRAGEFDSAFHPIQTHTEVRWRGIARAWMAGASMPPVELIRVGDIYFVRDGHHRISVARALGQREIEAVVTVWQVERPAAAEPPPVEQRKSAPADCGPAVPRMSAALPLCDC